MLHWDKQARHELRNGRWREKLAELRPSLDFGGSCCDRSWRFDFRGRRCAFFLAPWQLVSLCETVLRTPRPYGRSHRFSDLPGGLETPARPAGTACSGSRREHLGRSRTARSPRASRGGACGPAGSRVDRRVYMSTGGQTTRRGAFLGGGRGRIPRPLTVPGLRPRLVQCRGHSHLDLARAQ